MSITKTDIAILMSMSIAVIAMSFTFPALGLAGNSVNSTNIPKFNTTANTFNWEKEQPAKPGGPSEGMLNHTSNQFDSYEGSIQYELGKNENGNRTVLIANPEETVKLNDIEKISGGTLDSHTFTGNKEEASISGGGFTVDLYSIDYNDTGTYEFVVTERPSDKNWASGIPVIGGIVSGGNQLAAIVGWLGAMIFYFLERFAVSTTNFFVIIFNVISFIISLLHWILSTYYGIVDNAPTAWASVFVAIPGILLSLEFSKIAMTFVDKIPGFG